MLDLETPRQETALCTDLTDKDAELLISLTARQKWRGAQHWSGGSLNGDLKLLRSDLNLTLLYVKAVSVKCFSG